MGMTHSQAQETTKVIRSIPNQSDSGTHEIHQLYHFSLILMEKQGLQFIDGVVVCRKPYFYGLQGCAPAEAVINKPWSISGSEGPQGKGRPYST